VNGILAQIAGLKTAHDIGYASQRPTQAVD
jgi:hypothetical protein